MSIGEAAVYVTLAAAATALVLVTVQIVNLVRRLS